MHPKRYVIMDRDGTLIKEKNYLSDPDDVELFPQTAPALRRLRELGLGLVVVTNQSGINRGYFDKPRLEEIHGRMKSLLFAEDIELDGIYFCPHRPDEDCACRKPKTALIESAAEELGFKPQDAFVVGDNVCDIELGQRVDSTTILVETGYGKQVILGNMASPDHHVADIGAAAVLIEQLVREEGGVI